VGLRNMLRSPYNVKRLLVRAIASLTLTKELFPAWVHGTCMKDDENATLTMQPEKLSSFASPCCQLLPNADLEVVV
jgi:hypothetical protein